MKKLKSKNGITLIALIITIIILLILAIVTINILINQGIIGHAQTAVQKYDEQQVKENILLTYDEYKMQKFGPNAKSLYDFFKEKYDDVEDNGDGSITVTVESNGNTYAYTLKEDGTLENAKGLLLDKTSVVLNLENNKKLTDTLKVTLRGIEGEATWAVADSTIATISSTTGEEITVTAKKQGETKITVTCGDYTKECTVSVLNGLPIGEYINYDCFTGVDSSKLYYKSPKEQTGHTSDQEFQVTENPKWKILGKDDNGKILIIVSNPIYPKAQDGFKLFSKAGYVNGPTELDNVSKTFGNGLHAIGARSITVEDVIRTSSHFSVPKPKTYTYTMEEDGYVYRDGTKGEFQKLEYYDETTGNWESMHTGESKQFQDTHYSFHPAPASMFSKWDNGIRSSYYWFASREVKCHESGVWYVLRSVAQEGVGNDYNVRGKTYEYYYGYLYGVRPVVTLDITEVNNKVDGVWQIE